MKPQNTELAEYAARIEELAQRLGLDYYPVDFEVAPLAGAMRFEMLSEPKALPRGKRSFHKSARQKQPTHSRAARSGSKSRRR